MYSKKPPIKQRLLKPVHVYVTVNVFNQSICTLTEIFSQYVYCLIHSDNVHTLIYLFNNVYQCNKLSKVTIVCFRIYS